jgi:hypothetical protein
VTRLGEFSHLGLLHSLKIIEVAQVIGVLFSTKSYAFNWTKKALGFILGEFVSKTWSP